MIFRICTISFLLAIAAALAISQPFPLDGHTLALWRFDEGGDTILHDASAYRNDGVIHNCSWVPGAFGNALHFDGVTSYVEVPISSSLEPQLNFSIEIQFSPDTLQYGPVPGDPGASGVLISNLGPYPAGGGYQVELWTEGVRFEMRTDDNSSNGGDTISLPAAHRYYTLTATYQRITALGGAFTLVKTYLNNVLVDSAEFDAQVRYQDIASLFIGTNINGRAIPGNWAEREFAGTINCIRISDIARVPSSAPPVKGEFEVDLKVSDPGGNTDHLGFGVIAGATDGIDTSLGEVEQPPLPPIGSFDARWIMAGTNGSLLNYEDTLGGSRTINTYIGRVQKGPSGYPVKILWNASLFPAGSFYLEDEATGGSLYLADMGVQDSFLITDSTSIPFEIVYDPEPSILGPVRAGWNMLSLPCKESNPDYRYLFSGVSSEPFEFNTGGYFAVDSLSPGAGFWLKFDSAGSISLKGEVIGQDTITVRAGWNLIGVSSFAVPVDSLQTLPGDMTLSNFYGYADAYFASAILSPTKAYWVKTDKSGSIIIPGTSSRTVKRLRHTPASR